MSLYNVKCPLRTKEVKCLYCDQRGTLYQLFDSADAVVTCRQDTTTPCEVDSYYIPPSIGEKMSPDAVSKDRAKISKGHFKKEVLPTLDSDAKRWHKSKGN